MRAFGNGTSMLRRGRLNAVAVATALLLIVGATQFVPAARAAAPAIGIASSVEQIRPTAAAVARPTSASLVAARNETESFQIVVQGPAIGVSVSGNLFGWNTTRLHRVGYYDVTEPSDLEGATGKWGDILIPDKDMVYGEDRGAFPLDVPAGENRVVWVDVFVPLGTAAGKYDSSLTVASAGGNVNVPVSLEVLGIDLPSTSSLQNAFFATFNGAADDQVCLAHTGRADCGGDVLRRRLHGLYSRVALENRMTISNGYALRANESPTRHGVDWETDFEAPLIRATSTVPAGATYRLTGAKNTTVAAYGYVDYQCLQTCASQWKTEATEVGQDFSDRVMWYGCDEAGNNAAKWTACRDNLVQTNAGWQRPAFATTNIANWNAVGAPTGIPITTLVPLISHIQSKGGADQRSSYDAFVAQPGHAMWLYSACDSYGCGGDTFGSPSNIYTGWPGYGIDAPANQHRAMSWMAERYRASGELYWSAMEDLTGGWTPGGLFESGGNGDGTLFYPGVVAKAGVTGRIKGTQDIPLESARLKRLRDGREDYEYIQWLKGHGASAEVQAIVNNLYPTADSATAAKDGTGAGSLLAARNQLIDLIRARVTPPPPPPASTGRIAFSSNRDGDFDIFTMNPDGTGVVQVTNDPAADQFPAWSPDGKRLAWTRGADIWVANADGSSPTNLTADVTDAASKPAWNANGTQIFYVSVTTNVGNATDIHSMAANGTGKAPVITYATGGYSSFDPVVSAQGVLYFSQSGNGMTPGLFKTGSVTRVTSEIDEVADVSPDGTKLTFSRAIGGGQYDVLIANADASGIVNLTANAAGKGLNDFQSTFSPDGNSIAFASFLNGDAEIWTIGANGSTPKAITTNTFADLDPDWGPSAPAVPKFTVSDSTLTEGADGWPSAVFTVRLSEAATGPTSVAYATANGTAAAPNDFAAISGTLNFATGEVAKSLVVAVHGDALDEPNETFAVNLSNPSGATIDDGAGVGTIRDDDAAPSLIMGDVALSEGNAGSTIASFTVSLTGPVASTVTVNYATADSTAVAPGDYTAKSGSLSFAPGQIAKTVSVTVKGDTVDEENETFLFNLSGAVGAVIGDGQGAAVIRDDDPSATGARFSVSDVTVGEGTEGAPGAAFTVRLSSPAAGAVSVAYATAAGTAASTADFAPASGTLNFAAGEVAKSVIVNVKGDAIDEPNESFILNLSNPTGGATIEDASGAGTIRDDDVPAQLAIGDVVLAEGNGGSTVATLTVSLTSPVTSTVTVDFATANNTALTTADYTAKTGTLTFTPGQVSKTIAVTVKGDTVDENNETFLVNLANANNVVIGDAQGTATIRDDD